MCHLADDHAPRGHWHGPRAADQFEQFSICSQLLQPEHLVCHVHLVSQSLLFVSQTVSQFSET